MFSYTKRGQRLGIDEGAMENIKIQKSATPIATPTNVQEAADGFHCIKPSVLVLEKRGSDEMDVNAQRNAALHTWLQKHKTVEVKTHARNTSV